MRTANMLFGNGRRANVATQSDWNQTDSNRGDYIKNKPTLLAVGDWIEDISFEFRDVESGTAQTWILDIKASFAYDILTAVLESDDDMTAVAIEIEGTGVTGIDDIDLTADTIADTDATAANSVAIGDQVTIVTSGTDGGANTLLRGKLVIQRT